ncbi:hypothetical protein U0070_009929, partial [Myodes glareolus]
MNGDSWISQDQLSFTRRPNKTVHISCKLSGVPLQNTIVHWYQLREGEPIKRIFYGSAKTQKQDKLNSRLETDEKSDGTFYLIINNVIRADEATYYCACWDLTVSHRLKEPLHSRSLNHRGPSVFFTGSQVLGLAGSLGLSFVRDVSSSEEARAQK